MDFLDKTADLLLIYLGCLVVILAFGLFVVAPLALLMNWMVS